MGSGIRTMAHAVTQAIADNVNLWRLYRSPDKNTPPLDLAAVQNYYRIHPFAFNPADRPPLGVQSVVPPWNGAPDPLPSPRKRPVDQLKRDFIDQANVPGLPGDPAHWRGKQYLGSGTFGLIGLWEWIGPADLKPKHELVVVKQLRDPARSYIFRREADFLRTLADVGSPHIMRVLHEAHRVPPGSGIDASWDGVTQSLFLEYCPLGTIYDLLEKRIAE